MRFVFSKEDEESVKSMFTCISYLVRYFHFCHAVTFRHVLHLDVIRSQIELKLKVETEHFLMYGHNAGPPMAIPIYTVLPYCVIFPFKMHLHTVLEELPML